MVSICKVCGSKSNRMTNYKNISKKMALKLFLFKIFNFKEDYLDFTFNGKIILCNDCKYGVMQNPPNEADLKKYYEKKYWDKRLPTVEIKQSKSQNLRSNYQYRFIKNYIKPLMNISMLEIGAGPAFSSILIRNKIKNVKISIDVCETGEQFNEHYKNNNINRVAHFFPFDSNKKYDYIHCSHWLEHVHDLDSTVKNLKYLLNINGLIFIEVPNTEHFYFDQSSIQINHIPHIQFFSVTSLKLIFEKFSFKTLKIKECGETREEYYKGLSSPIFGNNLKGKWIRALFKKQ